MITVTDQILELHGHWKMSVYQGDNGPLLEEIDLGENLIVTSGKGLILDRIFGLSAVAAIASIGVGTDSTAAAVGQTQLNPSVAGTVLIETADTAAVRASLVVTIATTFDTGQANFSWNELGLFNGNVNGTSVMLNRIAPIGPFTKTSAVSIVVTVTITQS